MKGLSAAWATEKVEVVEDVRGGAKPRKTLRSEFEASGLGRAGRDAFYAGAAVAFEIYEEALDPKGSLSQEVEMIEALREEITLYAERAS